MIRYVVLKRRDNDGNEPFLDPLDAYRITFTLPGQGFKTKIWPIKVWEGEYGLQKKPVSVFPHQKSPPTSQEP